MQAVAYTRFSPRPKTSTDGSESLETQEQLCRAYCQRTDLEIIKILYDPDTSARRSPLASRPEGAALEAWGAKTGHIVALRLDRLFRSVVDGVVTLDRWTRKGITLHLVAEGGQTLNTGTPTGWLAIVIRLVFGEFEARLISARTSEAMKRYQQDGKRMGGRPPYGWRAGDEGQLEPEPVEQETLAIMLENASYGPTAIAAMLSDAGRPSRSGRPWNPEVVRRILTRPLVAEMALAHPEPDLAADHIPPRSPTRPLALPAPSPVVR